VVFVVVLVLMLKSFSAEAFVIPTGSMAPTLLGYNKWVTCPECGEEFPVNCSRQVDPSEGEPDYVGECVCPNCRRQLGFIRPPEWNGKGRYTGPPAGAELIPDPGWSSGDRVLVAKFVYDLFSKNPDRLDVVVFKYPGEADTFPYQSGPVKKHVPMNYIKRLIGLPGETIAIHRGKLFVLAPNQGISYKDFEKAAGDPNKLAMLWERKYTHFNEKQALDLFSAGKFAIVRKHPEVLLAMMRLVYDNDHQAKDLKGPEYQRWLPAEKGGWSADGATAFTHDGSSSTDGDWLRYRNILRGSQDNKPQIITDFTAYNTSDLGQGDPGNWASDLIVECQAKVEKAEGNLILELSRGPDRFQASFDLAEGTCTLFRLPDPNTDKREKLDSQPTRMKGKGTYNLRFANVDDRLTVWVDNTLVFGDGVEYKAPEKLAPTRENDLDRPVSIGAPGARLAISKLKLLRDVYYTAALDGKPHVCDVSGFRADSPETFPNYLDAPTATYYVQPEHFLCLGDNSPASSDSRTWGLVPKRLLLGKALLVYYPFNRAGRIR
jgi:signal peptidase I